MDTKIEFHKEVEIPKKTQTKMMLEMKILITLPKVQLNAPVTERTTWKTEHQRLKTRSRNSERQQIPTQITGHSKATCHNRRKKTFP